MGRARLRSPNKAPVREYLDAFNDRDRDALANLLAEDVVEHGAHEHLEGVDEIWIEEDRFGLLEQIEAVEPEHAHFWV